MLLLIGSVSVNQRVEIKPKEHFPSVSKTEPLKTQMWPSLTSGPQRVILNVKYFYCLHLFQ